ncbi:MAG TPA: class I SAM-dependent methyltransferase, partial [Firmicutes bacterium]|nr:class I SAM-dependent methyltransferase [Bacillota bacterium]
MSENQNHHPEEMAAFFDARADGYDRHMKNTVAEYNLFYEAVAEPILPTEERIRILDLGCGTGLELKEIIKKTPQARVTGIDMSRKMLDLLAEKHKNSTIFLELIQDSYETVVLSSEAYDYAVSVMSVHHLLPDRKLALYKKVWSALKPGGLYIEGDYVVTPATERALMAEYLEMLDSGQLTNTLCHIDIPFSVTTQFALLQEAGFCDIDVQVRFKN